MRYRGRMLKQKLGKLVSLLFLNYNKLDQNIDYLGLHKEIDIIVFAKKVRL